MGLVRKTGIWTSARQVGPINNTFLFSIFSYFFAFIALFAMTLSFLYALTPYQLQSAHLTYEWESQKSLQRLKSILVFGIAKDFPALVLSCRVYGNKTDEDFNSCKSWEIAFLLPGSKKTMALSAAYSLSSIWISWKGWTSSSSTRLATRQISCSGLFLWITQPLPVDTEHAF